jgi:putative ABC transport system permease protein
MTERTVAERVFTLVLWLYPSEFRDRFGHDMRSAYRAARMEAAARGRAGVTAFWVGVAIDALVRAPGEHIMMTLYDLKFAARALRRAPVFSLVAIVTLALGIGVNTTIFSVVHAVAIRPLGFSDPARLVRIWEKNDRLNIVSFATSVPNYMSWREQSRSFADLAAWRSGNVTLTGTGEPLRLGRMEATATLIPLLNIQTRLGRNFSTDEDRPGAARVAILVDSTWRDRFGSDPSIVGRSIALDGIPHTVVGVVRDEDVLGTAQVLTPLAPDLSREARRDHRLSTIGRLRADVTLAQAQQDMDAVSQQLSRQYPDSNRDWGVRIATFDDWIVPPEMRAGLYLLLGSVGLVLLIACSNVANLMLARAALRRREIGVRLALGASRVRLVRQVLTESLLVALLGGGAGLLIASWGVPILRAALASSLPRAEEIALNTPVLVFSLVVSVLTAVLFGALPAMISSRNDMAGALREGSRGSAGAQQGAARRVLVVAQVGLATVLLTGAALLVQSFLRLQHVNLGFDGTHLTTAMMGLPQSRYPTDTAQHQFYSRLLAEMQRVPGVEAAATSSGAPFAGGNTGMSLKAIGANALGAEDMQTDWRLVSPQYFRTLAIPVLRGRTFDNREAGEHGINGLILSAGAARRFWPDADPLGRQVQIGNKQIFQIIGIVGDVRNLSLDLEPRPTMYFSTEKNLWPTMTLVVRASGDAPMAAVIRQKVAALDPQLAVFNIRTMDTLLQESAAQPRLTAWLVSLFAALALALAAVGVYGVIAYLVAQRTQEIGVRMALGARRIAVVQLVLGHALRLSIAGALVGVAASALLAPAISSQLFGVSPHDMVTLGSGPIVLIAIAVLAGWWPALRATRVDPLVALRTD